MSDEGLPEGDIDLGTYVPIDMHQRVAAELLAIVAQRDGEIERLAQRVADMTRALRLIRGLIPISEGNVASGVLGALTVFAIAEAALAASDSK